MCLLRNKKANSKVLPGEFCVCDSEVEQEALQFLHILRTIVKSYSTFLNRVNKIRQRDI